MKTIIFGPLLCRPEVNMFDRRMQEAAAMAVKAVPTLGRNSSRTNIEVEFWLEKWLELWAKIPYTEKIEKNKKFTNVTES